MPFYLFSALVPPETIILSCPAVIYCLLQPVAAGRIVVAPLSIVTRLGFLYDNDDDG